MTRKRDATERDYDFGVADLLDENAYFRSKASRARHEVVSAKKKIQALENQIKEQREAEERKFLASNQQQKLMEKSLLNKEAEIRQVRNREAAMKAIAVELESQATERESQAAEQETRAKERESRAAEKETRATERESQAAEQETRAAEQETRAAKQEVRAAKQEVRAAKQEAREADLKALQESLLLYISVITGTTHPDGDDKRTLESDASEKGVSAPPTKKRKLDGTLHSIWDTFVCGDTSLFLPTNNQVNFNDSLVGKRNFFGLEAKELDNYQANPTNIWNTNGAELNERQQGQSIVLRVEETGLKHPQTALQMDGDEQDRGHAFLAATITGRANTGVAGLDESWGFLDEFAVNTDFSQYGVDFALEMETM